jgi:hypothetical protein
MKKIKQSLDYRSINPDAVVTYHASNMVLARHSNALYLSKINAQSRAKGHFFMSSNVELIEVYHYRDSKIGTRDPYGRVPFPSLCPNP